MKRFFGLLIVVIMISGICLSQYRRHPEQTIDVQWWQAPAVDLWYLKELKRQGFNIHVSVVTITPSTLSGEVMTEDARSLLNDVTVSITVERNGVEFTAWGDTAERAMGRLLLKMIRFLGHGAVVE